MLEQMTETDVKPLGPLLTCVLFVCIEFMQNKDKESLIHLEQGRQILAQLEQKARSTNPEMDMIKQHLVPMYTRMSLTSFMFGGNPVPIPPELKMLQDVPCAFESIDEAQYYLYDLMEECMRFTRRTRLGRSTKYAKETGRTLEQQKHDLMAKLDRIDVAYSLYQASKPTGTQESAIKLLSIHLNLNRVCLATALSTKETAFDAHLPDFAAIIPLASAFLEASSRQTSTDRKYSAATGNPVHPSGRCLMFSFGLHVIAPLYFVATKCRHPIIRRAALDLLRRNSSRRENLWRANIMAEIAARTIRLEESTVVPDMSMSPPYHPVSAETSSQGVTPKRVWATSAAEPDIPLTGLGQMMEHLSPDPRFDLKPHRVSKFTDMATSMAFDSYSISSLAGDSITNDLDMPSDPSLLLADTETSSQHSFASSLDDSHETSAASPRFTLRNTSAPSRSTLPWQPTPCVTPSINLEPPTPLPGVPSYNPLAHTMQTHANIQNLEHMGSQHSSAQSEDEVMSDQEQSSSSYSGTTAQRKDSAYNTTLSREAPFDLPEHLRVHDVIIGPEKEDGSWIMMFRKLGGVEADWDVTTEFVSI